MKRQVIFLIILFSVSFLLTTILFWSFEHGRGSVENFGDVVWWWFVTSSTVGYGDLVPVTVGGRVAGVIAIVVGIFGYTHVISLILKYVQRKFEEEERGRGSVDHTGHVVICEYTAFADELIQEIRNRNLYRDREIVVVGALVDRKPYPEYDFIYGVPISPQALLRANIEHASTIFVFANIRFSDPDTKTLHVVSRIMQYNTHGTIYVELENEEHPLLKELPRQVTVMNSADLLKNALRHNYISLKTYRKKHQGD